MDVMDEMYETMRIGDMEEDGVDNHVRMHRYDTQ